MGGTEGRGGGGGQEEERGERKRNAGRFLDQNREEGRRRGSEVKTMATGVPLHLLCLGGKSVLKGNFTRISS